MTDKPIIYVDADDVLIDLLGSVIDFIKTEDGFQYERAVFTKDDFFSSINRSDLRFKWKDMIDRGGYVYNLPENSGARTAIDILRERFIIHPATAPLYSCEKWMFERAKWLHDRMDFPYRDQIHSAAKYRLCGDVLIDDRVSNLSAFHVTNPNALLIIFDQPWNANEKGPWVRAKSMAEVVKIVEGAWPSQHPR